MKNTVLMFIIFILSNQVFAQEANSTAEIEREINIQVWKPFKQSLEKRNWEKHINLYTENVLSVSKWGIKKGDTFKDQIKEWYQKKDSIKRTFDIWFEYRLYSENIGCEVGFYRIINKTPDGKSRHTFGRFHVVLNKIDDEWKIAQDWDADSINGIPVSVKDFEKGTPLDFKDF